MSERPSSITKCLLCGAPVRSLGIRLDEMEIQDAIFTATKHSVAKQALRFDIIPFEDFKPGQIYDYMRSALDNYAEAEFLNSMFIRKMRDKYSIDPSVNFEFMIDGLYVHTETQPSCQAKP